ncbi:aspartyl-tRNA(Asn)/glutamyl-tRNA(Gln) amidotransferase subunit C [Candidatus Hakubella thermalkaliphila]|uniref:Aspartyl/glutamyl-tRNA(Asn/Gln) amidotransferase subunit C n=1 Tax=Candidatus Hakubella thermalkaliphila TaxID=2754717 RepID=A0A6V8QGT9_9ACTN|nr:Asp-tRNA(Asn)/Glu-tRNA(Gln) amidotransferase subunit GatC [Candidatus Hakubella thermalkaliphila]GFP18812.1 aspartyl-tRNA(Asn)/glutamyl-tRNA(Gln) amidotransferase subunit C [Candidatus Hakubella thermalkaliphila]GFP23705.1 aspartyl-tRNA(Asn)/glutamyl-tRNA(Gln) amidotransferase subunit C [Candidatus Hakubella thermalkaliphila]GFP29673.1 aspartyl-tRNA(Asn)/glutamyl-tRNA(Gln) amidotransferase subunit C [Candidatus Hakubella thermalkaliphila]GFP36380.1 aspartyl-tRNA(Asn)/glutamyl-tRNA(Gln) amido
MSRISREEVEHIARLAELEFSEEEKEKLAVQLNQILEHAGRISQLDIKDVPPTSHVLPLTNVFREDEPRPSLSLEEVLANAAEVLDNCFLVPQILEEG